MTQRRASRLAWSLCVLSIATAVVGIVLAGVMSSRTLPRGAGDSLGAAFVLPVIALPWSVVGAVVASRRPENHIVWLFSAIGLGLAALGALGAYASFALYGPLAPLPGGRLAAWSNTWLFAPCVFVGPILTFFVFPNGHFLSPRWRFVGLTLVGLGLVSALGAALHPGVLDGYGAVTNPLGVPGTAGRVARVLDDSGGVAVGPAAFAGAVVAIVRRFREASGIEHQQLKWVAYAVAFTLVSFLVSFLAPPSTVSDAAFFFGLFGLVLMPVCTGVAILRYRLYEIDAVINRTLVYGSLTVCLAVAYLVTVILLQLALSPVTRGSSLAVAASTLAVAAAFRPARSHIQRLVDRRFYRRRYDAQRTLEAFSSRLRDEVDLGAMNADLGRAVRETLQPAHVSLWLAPRRTE